ncbi:VWA domain-containing protein [Methylocella sp.]|uniref:VWA domain-containing protein n=1 Tax=Methylocella sp. TaxID=1978226 RepID=UPI0035B457BB
MISYGDFALLRPWWLAALPLIALMALAARRRAGFGDWERAADPGLLAVMARRSERAARRGARRFAPDPASAALACLALALAGPALRASGAERHRNLDANLILVDLSAQATSLAQLRQSRAAAQLALEAGASRQAGLVLYAGDAYLAAPATDDSAAVGSLIFAYDGETVPDAGARPDKALALARRIAKAMDLSAGDVTLISSGAGLDEAALAEARALRAQGLAVHALFLAADARDAETDAGARRAALGRLAAAGGGAAADAAAPRPVLDAVAGRAIRRLGDARAAALFWRDLGPFVLPAAGLFLLLALRRGAR